MELETKTRFDNRKNFELRGFCTYLYVFHLIPSRTFDARHRNRWYFHPGIIRNQTNLHNV